MWFLVLLVTFFCSISLAKNQIYNKYALYSLRVVYGCKDDVNDSHLRKGVDKLVFEQCQMVRLSSSARGQITTGEVLNLLNVDISRIRYVFLTFSDLAIEPFMVCNVV